MPGGAKSLAGYACGSHHVVVARHRLLERQLRGVLAVFDTSEFRNAERWACKAAALREVYAVLRKPWPEDVASAAE
jgi:hypothetical protein